MGVLRVNPSRGILKAYWVVLLPNLWGFAGEKVGFRTACLWKCVDLIHMPAKQFIRFYYDVESSCDFQG